MRPAKQTAPDRVPARTPSEPTAGHDRRRRPGQDRAGVRPTGDPAALRGGASGWGLALVGLLVSLGLGSGPAIRAEPGAEAKPVTAGLAPAADTRAGETAPTPLPEPLDLLSSKRIALRGNPSLQATESRIRAATALVSQLRSANYPTLTLGADLRHTEDSPVTPVGTDRDPFNSYGLSSGVSWLLFDGFSREASILAARYGEAAAREAHADAQRLLLRAVTVTFNHARLARENVSISRQDADFNRALTEETRKRFDAGAAARSEVLNFQIRTAEADSRTIEAERAFSVLRVALAELLGIANAELPAGVGLEPVREQVTDLALPELEAEYAFALEHRPDLRFYERSLRHAQARVSAAEGGNWPKLYLDGAYGLSRDDSAEFSHDRDAHSYVGLSARWDVFTGGRVRHETAVAKAGVDEAQSFLDQRRIAILSEIRQQLETLRAAVAKVKLQESIFQMTGETRDLVHREYAAGRTALTRLNEAQTDLVRAAGNLASGRILVHQALDDVTSATGRNLLEARGE